MIVMTKANVPTLRETVRLTSRCIKDLNKACPGLVFSYFLSGLISSATPYVTVCFSAQIINELACGRRPDVLWKLVVLSLLTWTVLALINAALRHWKAARQEVQRTAKRCIFSKKILNMDYAEVDNQKNRDDLSQVLQNEFTTGWGMGETIKWLDSLLAAIVHIICASILLIGLFTHKVPESGGKLVILNHIIFVPILIGLMALSVLFNKIDMINLAKRWTETEEKDRLANRQLNAFGERFVRQQNALDMRMYRLYDLAATYSKRAYRHFGVDGIANRWHRGVNGVVFAICTSSPAIIIGTVYVFVCLKALGGAFGIGSVTQYITAATTLSGSMVTVLHASGFLRNSAIFLRNAYAFLDIPNSMYQGSLTTEKRSDRQYDVEFRDVSFKYPGSDLWALRHVNMKFKVGKRLAIVGENGSGKTTFIKLLCRLYDPQEGQILLNGIDIRKYRYDDYMNIFSVVFQDFQLISQPLGNNVAGSAEYDQERARKALIDAGFGERLDSLPDGLDTQLYKDFGKDGVDISGGEAQKIAIARALYKDAPFIILDEPTAALDPVAEAEIYAKFNDISGDKTAVYISHRLSSCKFCDEIAVFHQGAVVQQGTHEQLLSQAEGKYFALWNAQAQYYVDR